ncbi:serine/threonine protein kinase [Nocardioides mangrovicus]|uniref:non-specific serine/threonine protein kinase n=1 Tax=Nocardioides mangrovicus TaxID=2478913 RepID=A0A3L8P099_9ACTN|nr:RIO1 family regulatory kinase/ATPase [Nocardioides mangrovicus]RLV48865.1 serine/threonine protein kinase [Nocardioides mangrovicus]
MPDQFSLTPLDQHWVVIDDDVRLSNYWDLEPLCRGPEPRPDWVVTDRAAVDEELGVLKTGKEADVFLLERAGADGATVMAAKRYRGEDHRDFQRSSAYAEGRRVRSSRDTRAMAKKTAYGRAVAAGQWANAEWESLKRLWLIGVPVPYPVQIDGTEILMELVLDPDTGDPAPRLARQRPTPALLASWFEQLREAMLVMASQQIAHGDLSPYNVLAAGERLVVIDLPQVVDLVANPAASEFLMRDCHNVCTWFAARGLEVSEDDLFGEVLAAAW